MRREHARMEAAVGGALGRVPRRSPALIAAAALLGTICALGIGLLGYRLIAASGGFDVREVDVTGTAVGRDAVRTAALRQAGGVSLLQVDPHAIATAVAAQPRVRRATVDRAFPNTLAIRIVPERPAAVAPTGDGRVVLSSTGRVLGRPTAAEAGLPVIAAAPADIPGAGGVVRAAAVLDEIAVARAMRRGLRARMIAHTADGLVARTPAGVEIRLGDGTDVAAKLRVARSVLRRADGAVRYVDVSVPAAPALRLGAPDPQTADAPPPSVPVPTADSSGGDGAGSSPAESVRSLFG